MPDWNKFLTERGFVCVDGTSGWQHTWTKGKWIIELDTSRFGYFMLEVVPCKDSKYNVKQPFLLKQFDGIEYDKNNNLPSLKEILDFYAI